MKKDTSANSCQKCLILCNTILLNVLHNTSLTVLLPFQTTSILRAFLATFDLHFHICKWSLICMIQQAYKNANLTLWSCLMFFKLEIANILKSSGDWKRVNCHGNRISYSSSCVSRELLAYQVSMVCGANWPR